MFVNSVSSSAQVNADKSIDGANDGDVVGDVLGDVLGFADGDGDTQIVFKQLLETQSESWLHISPCAHGAQLFPPQSTSVSLLSTSKT